MFDFPVDALLNNANERGGNNVWKNRQIFGLGRFKTFCLRCEDFKSIKMERRNIQPSIFSFFVWFFFIVHDLEWLFEISLINYYGTSGPFNWARKSGKGKNKNVKGRDAQLKQEREKERKKEIEIERKRKREREREKEEAELWENLLWLFIGPDFSLSPVEFCLYKVLSYSVAQFKHRIHSIII